MPSQGWYPDPIGEAPERWWDGESWTTGLRGNLAPSTLPAPVGYPPPVEGTATPGYRPSGARFNPVLVMLVVIFLGVVGGVAYAFLGRSSSTASPTASPSAAEPLTLREVGERALLRVDDAGAGWTALSPAGSEDVNPSVTGELAGTMLLCLGLPVELTPRAPAFHGALLSHPERGRIVSVLTATTAADRLLLDHADDERWATCLGRTLTSTNGEKALQPKGISSTLAPLRCASFVLSKRPLVSCVGIVGGLTLEVSGVDVADRSGLERLIRIELDRVAALGQSFTTTGT